MAENRLRRLRHPWRATVFCVVLMIASSGSFLAGHFIRPPQRAALAAAQEDVTATAPVQRRVVDSRISYAGEVTQSPVAAVSARSLPDVAVVTRQDLAPGDALASGALVAVVAGEPYFVFTGPLPLYRDLRTGDRGDDVEALQHALNTAGADIEESGWVDWATIHAVDSLFDEHAFSLPDETAADGLRSMVIPAAQLLGTPSASGTIDAVAGVGETLTADSPLVTVRTAPNAITLRADAVASTQFAADASLAAQAGTMTFPVTVTAVGEFTDGSNGQVPGRDVVLRSTDPVFLALPAGSSVTVLSPGAHDEALTVPLTAVRQDNGGDYVTRCVSVDGESVCDRVVVTIDRTGGGWAAIQDGELGEGDIVVVS